MTPWHAHCKERCGLDLAERSAALLLGACAWTPRGWGAGKTSAFLAFSSFFASHFTSLLASLHLPRLRTFRSRAVVLAKPGGNPAGFFACAPSMGAVLRVQVPSEGGHPDRSEPQLRKGDRPWEGSGERNRRPMYKNRIRGDAERGERASDREAPMTKLRRRKSGGRAVKDSVLTWGDLASRSKG